jgi:hypothetical protein
MRSTRAATGTIVPLLDALVEGSWIAVLDAALASVSGSSPLGPIPFAIAAGLSLYWVRHAADRATAIIGLAVLYVVACAGAGLLAGAFAGAVSPDGYRIGISETAAALGAVAVFRGSRHADSLDDDLVVGGLLRWGLPLLALPWLIVTAYLGAGRETFAGAAFPATLLFVAAGLLALGLSRLDALAALSGVNWRTNRAWLVLLGAVLAAMVAIAVPSAFLLGTPITLLAAGLMGPLAVVMTPFAAVFRAIVEAIFFVLGPLIDLLQSLARQRQKDEPVQIGGAGTSVPPPPDTNEPATLAMIVLVVLVIAAAVALFALILWLTHRPRPERHVSPEVPLEEREFRPPKLALHRPHLGLLHRRPRPVTASQAYVAFISGLGGTPDLARQPHEPPATHAARLREAGFGDPRAAFLAADYALERYAQRPVSERETARALRRVARLLHDVRQRPRPGTTPPAHVEPNSPEV